MEPTDIQLIAHLLRRAGFGARRDELEDYVAKGYEAVVDDLVNPERLPDVDEDLLNRYSELSFEAKWFYRMANTHRPLLEKMALFWHGVLATGSSKSGHHNTAYDQILMFREIALADLRSILIETSKDPAMIFWLDNNENVKEEPNENYGRELLELFSMGVGNYTEEDVKASTQAFTGWSFQSIIPGSTPYGKYPTHFVYRDDEHDVGAKRFLGQSGRLNGEDVIDVVVKQPATARFIARHLYTFFVADEPGVASWNELPPQDADAIDTLVTAYFESGANMRHILRVLFNSDFFKEASYRKVKSPTEVVTGVMKLTGDARFPATGIQRFVRANTSMGQTLTSHVSVEGWHTGPEWIDGGTLNERVNFAINEVEDIGKPGIKDMIERFASSEAPLSPGEFVERSLDLAGPVRVDEDTKAGLLTFAESGGELTFGTEGDCVQSSDRIVRMLQLIVSAREYQFG